MLKTQIFPHLVKLSSCNWSNITFHMGPLLIPLLWLWCGVSGENGIREALRIVNGPFLSLSLFSLLLFSNGVWFYLPFLVFPILGCLSIVLWFLDVFAFLVHFLCTGLCFFNILLSYLSKKKKKKRRLRVYMKLCRSWELR